MRRLFLLGTLWALTCSGPARGQSWVDTILPERSFDFGTVARGSKVRHTFKLINRLDQDVRIVNWTTKCGCTEVRVGAREIPPGTQTTIEAVIDTSRFTGPKPSGLTLILDKPGPAQVELNTTCFIRSDIVLTPGGVDFQVVSRGADKPTQTLSLVYAGGQSNWGITRMQTRSAHVNAKLQEQGRSPGGQVQYTLTATLDPKEITGFFKDEITLYTNDQSGPTIPVSVTANVQSAVTVSPSPLLLGPVKAGQTVTKTLLVRSGKPFKVLSVKPSRDDVTVVNDDKKPAGPVHTLNLTFKVPNEPGPYNAVCEIETDLPNEPPAKVTLFATVAP